jgi:hypothetical protein
MVFFYKAMRARTRQVKIYLSQRLFFLLLLDRLSLDIAGKSWHNNHDKNFTRIVTGIALTQNRKLY